MKTSIFISIFTLLTVFPRTAAAQQPASGIQGVVVLSGTSVPLSKANVELRDAAGAKAVSRTRTDGEGKFFLPDIPPGKYGLIATRDGYVKAEYGQRQPGGPAINITLAAGQQMNVQMSMTKGGVISGRITDKGQPVGIADVVALKAAYVEGRLVFTEVLSAKTDDLGRYHIFWLPPGRYYVVTVVWDTAATTFPVYITPDGPDSRPQYAQRRTLRAVLNRAIGSGAADNEAHVPVYFPGTTDSTAATPIEIRPGADVHNVDIDASALPIRHVRGRVVGLPENSPQQAQPEVLLFPLGARLSVTDSIFLGMTQADRTGSFDISRVPGGSYAAAAITPDGQQFAVRTIDVRDRDIDGLTLTLSPALKVTGRVTLDTQGTTGPAPDLKNLRILFRPEGVDEDADVLTPKDDGSFQTDEPPWNFRLFVSPILMPPGSPAEDVPPALENAYVKSIRLGEKDILNDGLELQDQPQAPIEIVIGTNGGSLDGRVLDSQGQPLGSVWVALIPEGPQRFHIDHKYASTDASGRFELHGIAPGDFKLFAWEDTDKGSWQDPGFVRLYEGRATPVHINEGQKTAIDVTSLPSRN